MQSKIGEQRVARRIRKNTANLSPLAGMLVDEDSEPLQPSHTSKGPAKIRYRSYISKRLETDLAADHPTPGACQRNRFSGQQDTP